MKVATKVLTLVAVLALMVFLALYASGRVHAASFNCYAVTKPTEAAICQDSSLGLLDELNAKIYYQIRDRLVGKQREAFNANERYWLDTRNMCGVDINCITLAYQNHQTNLCELSENLGLGIPECEEQGE